MNLIRTTETRANHTVCWRFCQTVQQLEQLSNTLLITFVQSLELENRKESSL